ncbi:MAG: ATP-binding cassette domain-containing protein [Nitrospirae bacterium]|nr:MAG: ATP-binding cassette domain-containing protein [Nitrospirota bacterium]
MADRADSSGDKLSVGQSKRVAIARMLQTGAQMLLLDEPLAGLDHESAEKLVHDLNRLADTTHKAMLVVEHNHDAMIPVCDIRLTLTEGRLHREDLEGKQWGR